MSDTLDRPLPQAPEAERAVLGSILTNGANYWRIVTLVDERDFFSDAHRAIYRAIATISEEHGAQIDSLTVRHTLADMGLLEAAGGHAYVASLTDGIPDIGNVERYARIVKEKADLRRILVNCNAGMRRALDASEASAATIASEVAAELQGLAISEDRQSRSVYDVVRDVQRKVREREEAGRARAVLTGFSILDYHRVLRRKALTIFAAPSSHGKSTLMLNAFVGTVRCDPAIRSTLFSLEMSDEDVSEPLLSMISHVPLRHVQDRVNLTEEQGYRLGQAVDWIAAKRERLFFADKIRDIDSLYADCRKRKMTTGLDVVIVDYLQLIRGFDERVREQDVDRIARALFMLSQDLDIAVATGSQVNKDREKRAGGRLSIRDLKYGEVIGNHARIVCMWQCPRQDDKANLEIPWCEVKFAIEKNSGRETGDVNMHVDFRTQTFAEGDCAANGCPRARNEESGSLFKS